MLRYLGEKYGVPLQSRQLRPQERAQYARQQRDLKRLLPAAHRWQRSAIFMSYAVLARLKAPLEDPKDGPVLPDEIRCFEEFLRLLRRMEGVALVDEYRRWTKDNRQFTDAMLHAAEVRDAAELLALEAYWAMAEARTA